LPAPHDITSRQSDIPCVELCHEILFVICGQYCHEPCGSTVSCRYRPFLISPDVMNGPFHNKFVMKGPFHYMSGTGIVGVDRRRHSRPGARAEGGAGALGEQALGGVGEVDPGHVRGPPDAVPDRVPGGCSTSARRADVPNASKRPARAPGVPPWSASWRRARSACGSRIRGMVARNASTFPTARLRGRTVGSDATSAPFRSHRRHVPGRRPLVTRPRRTAAGPTPPRPPALRRRGGAGPRRRFP